MMSIVSLFSVYAENDSCSLTLHCEVDNNQQTTIIADDEFAIVQIADILIDNFENPYNFQYVALEKYKADIPRWEEFSSSQMRDTAKILSQKVHREDYFAIKKTDSNGNVTFSSLPSGLYLVLRTETNYADYIFEPFIVTVPQNINGSLTKDVVSSPKFERQKSSGSHDSDNPDNPDNPDSPNSSDTPSETVIIRNGDYLPQTGQMILPVFIFLGLGIVCITAGIILSVTGKQDEEE